MGLQEHESIKCHAQRLFMTDYHTYSATLQ